MQDNSMIILFFLSFTFFACKNRIATPSEISSAIIEGEMQRVVISEACDIGNVECQTVNLAIRDMKSKFSKRWVVPDSIFLTNRLDSSYLFCMKNVHPELINFNKRDIFIPFKKNNFDAIFVVGIKSKSDSMEVTIFHGNTGRLNNYKSKCVEGILSLSLINSSSI